MRRKLEAPNLGSLKPLFFPNHNPTLTLTSLKYRFPNPDPDEKTKEVLKVASENLFERWTVCAEITFISKIVSPMGVSRRLEALTDNSSKFRDLRKHLSPSTITPTLTITLLNYPYPNLNLTLIQKTKALCKFGQFFRLSRTKDKLSTSCRVPNKIPWHWDTHILLSTLYTHTMLNVRELTAIGNRWNLETRPTNVVQKDGYRENDGYRVPAGYRVQHIQN